MNGWLTDLGFAAWKPLLTALLLPPTPLLLMLAIGIVLQRRKPISAQMVCGLAATAIWLTSCSGVAEWLRPALLRSVPPLSSQQIVELRLRSKDPVAIIVLGGGVEDFAPEYAASSLAVNSLERLRYGIWLAHQTGWPLGFSGGSGWGQSSAPASAASSSSAEATVAQKMALAEWGVRLQWVEAASRDTHENAVNTVDMLRRQGIRRIVLVTHEWHMLRAMRNFVSAAGDSIRIEAAPIGLAKRQQRALLRWMPSGEGLTLARQVIRERLGLFLGA